MAECPACGFDSPDGAICCDFCKEPFRRGRPAAPPKPAEGPGAGSGIPPEFRGLDTGGSVPPVPPWLRYAAWAVLAVCLVAIMAFAGTCLARQKSL